jgi:hypothetical protein
MDTPGQQRRLWPLVVAGVATAAIAFATAGAAVSEDGSQSGGNGGSPEVDPALVLPG